MNSLQLYALLILTIVPNTFLQAMIKDSGDKQPQEKQLKRINAELVWLPHGEEGEKDVCDCPKIDNPYESETLPKLTCKNVMNSFWEKIEQCGKEERDKALEFAMAEYKNAKISMQCRRRFLAAAACAGADPNLMYNNCRPLFYALWFPIDYPLTKFLLKHRANPSLQIASHGTAFDFAASNEKLKGLLNKYREAAEDVSVEEMPKKVQASLKKSASLKLQDNKGKKVIHDIQRRISWHFKQKGAKNQLHKELIKKIQAAENKK